MAIHIFKEQHDGEEYQVWTDCESGEHKSGRCLASGQHPHQALIAARKELEQDLTELSCMMKLPTPAIYPSPG